jgi:hypothetical protein
VGGNGKRNRCISRSPLPLAVSLPLQPKFAVSYLPRWTLIHIYPRPRSVHLYSFFFFPLSECQPAKPFTAFAFNSRLSPPPAPDPAACDNPPLPLPLVPNVAYCPPPPPSRSPHCCTASRHPSNSKTKASRQLPPHERRPPARHPRSLVLFTNFRRRGSRSYLLSLSPWLSCHGRR